MNSRRAIGAMLLAGMLIPQTSFARCKSSLDVCNHIAYCLRVKVTADNIDNVRAIYNALLAGQYAGKGGDIKAATTTCQEHFGAHTPDGKSNWSYDSGGCDDQEIWVIARVAQLSGETCNNSSVKTTYCQFDGNNSEGPWQCDNAPLGNIYTPCRCHGYQQFGLYIWDPGKPLPPQ